MPIWLVAFLVLAVIVGNYYALQAFRHLSAYGRERRARLLFLVGLWAGRQYFTEEGWRYRNRVWYILGVWVAVWLIWFFVSLPQN